MTSLPVSFQVKNTNTTTAPGCTPDGAAYTVRGHLTAPAKGKRSGVTLYLHGLGLGEWLWNFQQVKGYNFVAGMARPGNALGDDRPARLRRQRQAARRQEHAASARRRTSRTRSWAT